MSYKTVMHPDGRLEKIENGNMSSIRSDMTKEEWNALADSKLQELLQTTQGSLLLSVIKESKDRIEGKPLQRQELTADVRAVTVEISAMEARNDQIKRILSTGKVVK